MHENLRKKSCDLWLGMCDRADSWWGLPGIKLKNFMILLTRFGISRNPNHRRRLRQSGGVVEREGDRLPCSGAVEMPAGGAESWWRGRHGRECGRRGGATVCGRGAAMRWVFSFFRTVGGESR
jgi:hypothetical protein